jgi:HD-like signal output (HDOD) protein
VLLGFKIITTIVLSVTVFDMFPESKRSRQLFDRKAFWLHSLCCGLIARRLALYAKKRFLFDPEELFCAGLLHDIGKIVLEQYLHEEFHQSLKTARDNKIPQHIAEKDVMGFSHADVAQWLIAGWGLPPQIAAALALHHGPFTSESPLDSAGVCHIADWLCYSLGMVIDSTYQTPEPESVPLATIGLTPEYTEELREKIEQELESSSLFLSM